MRVFGYIRSAIALLLLLTLGGISSAQTVPVTYESQTLVKVSETTVPSLTAFGLGAPLACDNEANIYMRLVTPNSPGGLVGISADAKSYVAFDTAKITDVNGPTVISYFVNGESVCALLSSAEEVGPEKMKLNTGQIVEVFAGKIRYWIAQFDKKGNYKGSRQLGEVPHFAPLQLAVFPHDGGYLVSGRGPQHGPRVAIFRWDGGFYNFVQLPKDIHEKAREKEKDEDSFALPMNDRNHGRQSMMAQLAGARMVADNTGGILFFRTLAGYPLYSIDPSGSIKTVDLKVPKGTGLWDIRILPDKWILETTQQLSSGPEQHSYAYEIYRIDPNSGQVLARYELPLFVGFGFACTDGHRFSFLRNHENNISLLNLIAQDKDPAAQGSR